MEANNKALAKVEKKVIALKAKGEEPDKKTKDKMAAAEAAVAADAEVKNQWAADDAAAKKAIDDEKDTAADLKAKYDAKAAEYNTVVEKVTKVVKAADKEEPKSGPSPDEQKLAKNKAMLAKDAADADKAEEAADAEKARVASVVNPLVAASDAAMEQVDLAKQERIQKDLLDLEKADTAAKNKASAKAAATQGGGKPWHPPLPAGYSAGEMWTANMPEHHFELQMGVENIHKISVRSEGEDDDDDSSSGRRYYRHR